MIVALLLKICLARFNAMDLLPWVETQGYQCFIPTGLGVPISESQSRRIPPIRLAKNLYDHFPI